MLRAVGNVARSTFPAMVLAEVAATRDPRRTERPSSASVRTSPMYGSWVASPEMLRLDSFTSIIPVGLAVRHGSTAGADRRERRRFFAASQAGARDAHREINGRHLHMNERAIANHSWHGVAALAVVGTSARGRRPGGLSGRDVVAQARRGAPPCATVPPAAATIFHDQATGTARQRPRSFTWWAQSSRPTTCTSSQRFHALQRAGRDSRRKAS